MHPSDDAQPNLAQGCSPLKAPTKPTRRLSPFAAGPLKTRPTALPGHAKTLATLYLTAYNRVVVSGCRPKMRPSYDGSIRKGSRRPIRCALKKRQAAWLIAHSPDARSGPHRQALEL